MIPLPAGCRVWIATGHTDMRRGMPGERLLGRPDLAQRCFPPTLEFAGDETIVGIDAVELAFCQRRSIPLPLELTFRAGAQRRVDLLLGPAGSRQRVKLGGRQRRQERIGHGHIHARSADVLARRQALVGAQMIAHILPAAFVANVHLVATSSAPSDAVQQKIAMAGSASRFDAHVFGSVVSYDVADFLIVSGGVILPKNGI
jgi:hypothetical protein